MTQQEQPDKKPRVWLRQRREALGLSQARFAKRLGEGEGTQFPEPSVKTIARWESGESTPYAYWWPRIADVFGITVSELERLLNEDTQPAVSPQTSAPIWMIPYPRHPFFTGRDDLLERLQSFQQMEQERSTIPIQAITGLGGIGKTMLAVEYAYRFGEQCAVFWAQAGSREALFAAFTRIAMVLDLPEKAEQDQLVIVEAVKQWLTANTGWLLIFDGVDDLSALVPFLPAGKGGQQSQILLTTRCQALGTLATNTIDLPLFTASEGITFLLHRAKQLALEAVVEQEQTDQHEHAARLVQALGGLPLALDQAGAYIEETGCTLAHYLEAYQSKRASLLQRRGTLGSFDGHPESVMVTFSLALETITRTSAAAADLLRLCAFLAPEAIPEELFVRAADRLPATLAALVQSPVDFDEALALIRRYSLIQRLPASRSLSLHQLVQAVIQDHLDERQQCASWEMLTVDVVARLFAGTDQRTILDTPVQRFLPQALAAVKLIRQRPLVGHSAGHLLFLVGSYLTSHACYNEAEDVCLAALQMYQEHFGPLHLETAANFANLARVYEEQGRYPKALALFEQALTVVEHLRPLPQLERAVLLGNIARTLWQQGNLHAAERFADLALPLLRAHTEPHTLPLADGLLQIATIYRDRGKSAQAAALYQEALAIYTRLLPPDHLAIGHGLEAAGTNALHQRQLVQAETLYRQALAIFQQVWGEKHPDVAGCQCRLADVYLLLGKREQVEELNMQALAVYESVGGPDSPEVSQPLLGLALLYQSQGEHARAEPLYRRAIAVIEKSQGKAHPDLLPALEGYAYALAERGALQEADAFTRRAEAIRQKMGEESADEEDVE